MNEAVPLLNSPLVRDDPHGVSLQKQLIGRFKQAILDGRLPAGVRLPSSRTLATELAISRNTVAIAYEQLVAEGFVVADRRGTCVARLRAGAWRAADMAASARHGAAMAIVLPARGDPVPRLAERVAGLPAAGTDALPLAFTPGVPALDVFPRDAWRRTLERGMRTAPTHTLGYGDPAGEPRLREAIAQYLRVSRGVRCDSAQVIVTEGAQEALALCVNLLANPGDTAWLEEPGYRGARTAFHAGDLRLVPIRTDAEGIAVPPAAWRDDPPRLIYTTPSHQYPLGAVLSVARRLELIALAQRTGAWIIEDDYDSEFRHQGEPIAAMQGLVPDAPVLYVGTFSKTMFPSLRIGFVVLPAAVAAQAGTAMAQLLRGGHRFEQLALAAWLESGQFARHLGRMRRLYRERQQALRVALAHHFPAPCEVLGERCGLHLTLRLPPSCPDHSVVERACRAGMGLRALSHLALAPRPEDNGLVIGYGNTEATQYDALVRTLAGVAREWMSG